MSEVSNLLDEAFDTEGQEGTPDTIPAGNYTAEIIDAVCGPLKSGKGQSVNLTWAVLDEAHSGHKLWQRLIVTHESAKAMEWGKRKLKDVCVACGFAGQLTDLTVLHNKACQIRVQIEESEDGQFPPKNVITKVKPVKPAVVNGGAAHPELNDNIPF
jgi:hypothetical protein